MHPLDGGAGPASLVVTGDRFAEATAGSTVDRVVELPGMCVVPGLSDSHIHQVEAEQDLDTVDVGQARTVGAVLALVRAAAAEAPAGAWLVTRRSWQEGRLAERRLPSPAEVDALGLDHPVAVRRGSHVAVLNRAALDLAAGLPLERGEGGTPTGVLRGVEPILALLRRGERPRGADREQALARTCAWHASRGLTGARDAGVTPEEVEVYERLAARGGLTVRTDVMVALPRTLDAGGRRTLLEELGPPPAARDPYLRVNGVKLFLDGHIADAALRGARPGEVRGTLHMDAAELARLAGRAVELGWRVGCHAVGDAALDVALDGYEDVVARHPDLPAGWLAVEHACLADAGQRRRAAGLGVGVTVQHPLLYAYGGAMLEHWGPERTAAASPARSWLAAGALVAAGSDGHVVPFDPLLSLWGLVTRGTRDAGVQGPAERLTLVEALRLYGVAGRWLSPWRVPARAFEPGSYADFVAFDRCLFEAPVEDLAGRLAPALTVAGGRASHDPGGLWP